MSSAAVSRTPCISVDSRSCTKHQRRKKTSMRAGQHSVLIPGMSILLIQMKEEQGGSRLPGTASGRMPGWPSGAPLHTTMPQPGLQAQSGGGRQGQSHPYISHINCRPASQTSSSTSSRPAEAHCWLAHPGGALREPPSRRPA
jgi:hypothetical protein